MITHRNLIATIAGAEPTLEGLMTKGDSYLSYLPLAHIFERAVVNTALYRGCRVGFYQGVSWSPLGVGSFLCYKSIGRAKDNGRHSRA